MTQVSSGSTALERSGGKAGKNLLDLLQHALKDIYYAEKKIYRTLPKIIRAAEHPELKSGLESHREETAGQIERLEQVFEILGVRPKTEKCDAIDGILDEGDELLEAFGGTPAGDAAIIFSCQAVEHYEITRYGSMHAYALSLGLKDVADLLETTLEQEKSADDSLTDIAETSVNAAAEAVTSMEDDTLAKMSGSGSKKQKKAS